MNKPIDQVRKFAWLPTSVIVCRKSPRKVTGIIWLEFYYEETEYERRKIPNKVQAFLMMNLPIERQYYNVPVRVKYWDKE